MERIESLIAKVREARAVEPPPIEKGRTVTAAEVRWIEDGPALVEDLLVQQRNLQQRHDVSVAAHRALLNELDLARSALNSARNGLNFARDGIESALDGLPKRTS